MRNLSAFQPNGVKNFELASTGLFADANLVSYWKMEDTSDSKGSNTLTNNNTVTFSSAKFNNGANLGTSNTNKSLTTSTNLGISGHTAMAISGWVKLTTEIPSGLYELFGHADSVGSEYFDLRYDYNAGTRRIGISTNFALIATYTITLGTSNWYHFVVSRDASYNYTIYINGISVATGTGGANFTGFTGFAIGCRAENQNANFSSAIVDDVAVFSRALTVGEIQQLYYSGSTKAYYPLNGNSTDYSGNGNTGTDTAITYPQGKFGQGARFSSNSSKIALPAITGTTLTVSAWLSVNSFTNFWSGLDYDILPAVATGGTGNRGYERGFILGVQSGTFLCQQSHDTQFPGGTGTGFGFNITTTITPKLNTWNHLLMSKDGLNVRFYVNGQLVGTATQETLANDDFLAYGYRAIGQYEINNNHTSNVINTLDGSVDEVIIESRAWTAKEVETYYRKSVLNYKRNIFAQIMSFVLSVTKASFAITPKTVALNQALKVSKTNLSITAKIVNLIVTGLSWTEKTRSSTTWTEKTSNTTTFTEKTPNSTSWTEKGRSN